MAPCNVVLVPFPFQGHLTPMLQLGSILHSKGFSITIAHTNFNSPNPSNHPNFTFLPLDDQLEDGHDTSFYNLLNVISLINTNCRAPFQQHMIAQLPSLIIYDAIMTFVDTVAAKLKLPTIVLRTTSPSYMLSHHIMFQLVADNSTPMPMQESQMEQTIPGTHHLRYKDLPLPLTMENIPQPVIDFQHDYLNIKSSSAVIWNTTQTLDPSSLDQLHHHWPVPFFPVGPFHKMTPPSTTSLMEEDNTCLSWLDKQLPHSVVYVSLGSIAMIQEEDLLHMAHGLAKSGHSFLWVIRPSLLHGSCAMECLPKQFVEMTRDRGRVVKWAPQKAVLAHPAVGAFLTHCGWNSTLEGICEGVPLICRPCFSDQSINARYVTHIWRVGVELNKATEDSIDRAIRMVMESEEGQIMRQRVLRLKDELLDSIKSGNSHTSLNHLVEFITSLRCEK